MTDTEQRRQFLLANSACRITAPNLAHVRFGESRHSVAFAVSMTALASQIAHIIQATAEKHMRGIDADFIISTRAVVADINIFGQRTVRQYPCDTVGVLATIPAIPLACQSSKPRPTTSGATGAINVLPKVHLRIDAKIGRVTRMRTKAAFSTGHDKRLAALGARCIRLLRRFGNAMIGSESLRTRVATKVIPTIERVERFATILADGGILSACHLSLLTGWGDAMPGAVSAVARLHVVQ